jgi:hypothetical protein
VIRKISISGLSVEKTVPEYVFKFVMRSAMNKDLLKDLTLKQMLISDVM